MHVSGYGGRHKAPSPAARLQALAATNVKPRGGRNAHLSTRVSSACATRGHAVDTRLTVIDISPLLTHNFVKFTTVSTQPGRLFYSEGIDLAGLEAICDQRSCNAFVTGPTLTCSPTFGIAGNAWMLLLRGRPMGAARRQLRMAAASLFWTGLRAGSHIRAARFGRCHFVQQSLGASWQG